MTVFLAYLDAGSGTVLLQALLGGVAGLVVGLKMFGRRVVSFLFFWRRAPAPSEPAASPVDES
jgi:hypothetical protein